MGQGFPGAPILQKPFSPISLVEIVREALTRNPTEPLPKPDEVPVT